MAAAMIRSSVLLLSMCAVVSAATVNDVLAKMDQSAASFTGMTANVRKVAHTEVINDNTEESGTITIKQVKAKDMAVLINFTKPDPRSIAYRAKKAEIYYPKLKTVQEYNLAKYNDVLEFFSLIGFGTTGKEIATSYNVKLAGEETIAGKPTVKLELTPKDKAKQEKLKRVDMWLADGGAYPVQERFVQASGDYNSFTYTDLKLADVPDSAVKLNLPSGVKREYPQK